MFICLHNWPCFGTFVLTFLHRQLSLFLSCQSAHSGIRSSSCFTIAVSMRVMHDSCMGSPFPTVFTKRFFDFKFFFIMQCCTVIIALNKEFDINNWIFE